MIPYLLGNYVERFLDNLPATIGGTAALIAALIGYSRSTKAKQSSERVEAKVSTGNGQDIGPTVAKMAYDVKEAKDAAKLAQAALEDDRRATDYFRNEMRLAVEGMYGVIDGHLGYHARTDKGSTNPAGERSTDGLPYMPPAPHGP